MPLSADELLRARGAAPLPEESGPVGDGRGTSFLLAAAADLQAIEELIAVAEARGELSSIHARVHRLYLHQIRDPKSTAAVRAKAIGAMDELQNRLAKGSGEGLKDFKTMGDLELLNALEKKLGVTAPKLPEGVKQAVRVPMPGE